MKLIKKTYKSEGTDKLVDKSFKELKTSTDSVTLTNFFEIYNKLFLQIPKTGTISHSTIFNRSGEYLKNPGLTSDKIIRDLKSNITKLEKKSSKLEAEKNRLEFDNKNKEQEILLLKQR